MMNGCIETNGQHLSMPSVSSYWKIAASRKKFQVNQGCSLRIDTLGSGRVVCTDMKLTWYNYVGNEVSSLSALAPPPCMSNHSDIYIKTSTSKSEWIWKWCKGLSHQPIPLCRSSKQSLTRQNSGRQWQTSTSPGPSGSTASSIKLLVILLRFKFLSAMAHCL